MFRQFRPSSYKPGLLNVTLEDNSSDPFERKIYDLEELEEYAHKFKTKRIKLGFTQEDVGQSIGAIYGSAFSQATISRFEALSLSFLNMCKLKPILDAWMEVAETEDYKRYVGWASNRFCASMPVTDLDRMQRRRRKRSKFAPTALVTLEKAFTANCRPTGEELDCISESLGFEKEVVRIWFCNRRAKIQRELKRKLADEERRQKALNSRRPEGCQVEVVKQSPLFGGVEPLFRSSSDRQEVKLSPIFGGLESLHKVASENVNDVTEFSLPKDVTEGGEVVTSSEDQQQQQQQYHHQQQPLLAPSPVLSGMHSLCKVASEEALQFTNFSLTDELFDRGSSNNNNNRCIEESELKPNARIPKFPPKFPGWSTKWSAKLTAKLTEQRPKASTQRTKTSTQRPKFSKQSPKLNTHSPILSTQNPKLISHNPKCPSPSPKTSILINAKCLGNSPTSSHFRVAAVNPKTPSFSLGPPLKSSFSNDSLYTVHENSFLGPDNLSSQYEKEEATVATVAEQEEEDENRDEVVVDDCVYKGVKLAHGSGYNGNKENEKSNIDIVPMQDNDIFHNDNCMTGTDIVCMENKIICMEENDIVSMKENIVCMKDSDVCMKDNIVCMNENDAGCMKDNIVCMTDDDCCDDVVAVPEYFNTTTGGADDDDILAAFYAQTA